jgi:AcrR family transcriptional regulator
MSGRPPRESILAAAAEQFHRRSYAAVTVEEIIAASGQPKAEFYRSFSGKSALGQAWLERLSRQMQMRHDDFLKRPGEPQDFLRRYFLSMQSWVESNNWRGCQFANTAACIDPAEELELAQLIDGHKRAQRRFFIALVAKISPRCDAQRTGSAIFLLFSGAMSEAQSLRAGWPFEDALAAAEQLCGLQGGRAGLAS